MRIRLSAIPFLILFSFVTNAVRAQLQFIENKGQWEKQITYKSEIPTGAFFLEKTGFTVLLHNAEDLQKFSHEMHKHTSDSGSEKRSSVSSSASGGYAIRSHAYKVNFEGASAAAEIIPDKPLSEYNNYFIGDDKTKWQGGCKIFQAVTYKNIYPGIDVHYYTDAGKLKYDLIIHPGGKVESIIMSYKGIDKMDIRNKELILNTSVGEVKELYPYTYQYGTSGKQTLNCRYVLKNGMVRFKIDDYSPDATIVIDPTLIFSSFTGSSSDNWGFTATPGPDKSFFLGGIVFGNSYPVSTGAFQSGFQSGGYDIAIMKISPDGKNKLYATYLGGNGREQPHSMICDNAGNLVVAGRSNSPNFPILPQSNSSFSGAGYDIIVTKFNTAGTAIIGSMKIGGSGEDGVNIHAREVSEDPKSLYQFYGDDARSEVILDANNDVVLASCTQSADFPVRNSVIQTTPGGNQDGVILKFSPTLSSVLFSTYFGGTQDDACFVLSVNPQTQNIYVAGGTSTTDSDPVKLPGSRTGSVGVNYFGGSADGFVTELKPDGSAVIRTTYIGTTGMDIIYGIKFDKFGFPYILGTTTGDWQNVNAKYFDNGAKQFIAELQPDLSAYVYSTAFGNNRSAPNISPIAFMVDKCRNVYVSGWGGDILGAAADQVYHTGTLGLPVTSDAIKKTSDNNDFYFFVLAAFADKQLFGSFFGQNGGLADHVDGGTSRFDEDGVIYQAICANCGGGVFPTTPGVVSSKNNAIICNQNGCSGCNEAAVKIEMNFSGVAAKINTVIGGLPDAISGCNPLTVQAKDSLSQAKKFIWNWGDGTKEDTLLTRSDTSHKYNLPAGTAQKYYTIRLIAEDSTKCNVRDTAYKTIKVSNNYATLALNYIKQDPCTNLTYQFINKSVAFVGSFDNKGFEWDFGDGTKDVGSISYNPSHTYASAGSYKVKLCVVDTFVCNSPECVDSMLVITSVVKAAFKADPDVCLGTASVFENTSTGASDYLWDFGDGTTSSESVLSVSHTYSSAGTYKVRLIAMNPNSCNKKDTTQYFTITVHPAPTANFSWSPNPPVANTATSFVNSSSADAVSFLWDFGDGTTSDQANPSHQFNATDTFSVCLTAKNAIGCPGKICKDVPALVLALYDVPNAFTPKQNDLNSVIKVLGFGISKMDWRIYNRWGQVVFQSTSKEIGWDGTYKGKLQPMDVYTYTLELELVDGKKVRRTGDITLIR